MRRIVSAVLSVLLGFSLVFATGGTASANALAGGGFSSSYNGESVFTNKAAGETGQFSVIFFNDGTQSWQPGVVGLLVCLADKTTCNVASPNAAYASGWFSSTVYATVSAAVAPGQNGFFIYNFVVPAGTAGGTVATFNGDVGLIATGAELRPQGYFQINTTPAVTGALTLSPTSASMAVGGQQQFTATGAPTGSTVSWTVTGGCGAVTSNGLFAATATNSPTQPCTVVASAGGLTASASITVFGPASTLTCSATKTTIPADASTTTTISATLKDANGNVVANDNSTLITFTNSTTSILSEYRSVAEPSPRTAQGGVASKTYISTSTAGNGVISLSSGSLTGCTQNITTTAPGSIAKLALSIGLATIAADGTSTALAEIDATDANGTLIPTATDTVSISRDSGASVCNIGGAGSGGPTAMTSGSAFFTITSTATPGTCSWTASANTVGVSTASATLTTVLVGAPSKLVVTANNSPKIADGASTMRVTVALQDANGNPNTTTASTVTVTATLGTGCSGTNAIGATDQVKFSRIDSTTGLLVTSTVTSTTRTIGSLTYNSILAASSNLARFTLTSTFATSGCTITLTSSNTSVSSTTTTVVFTAGGVAAVACTFTPPRIVADGSSTSIGTVSMVDKKNNLTTAGNYSVTFSRQSGDGVTTLLTTSQQTTSNGVASFTVRSGTTTNTTASAQVGTDTYLATAVINGNSVSTSGNGTTASTCQISTQVAPVTN